MDSPLSAKAMLLQALFAGPGYGLDLIERVRKRGGGRIRLHQGSAYPALKDLEREGLVRGWKGAPSAAGGRPRRYYELTPKGIATAAAQHETVTGFLGTERSVVPRREIRLMRERLRRCAAVSAFALALRGRMSAAVEPRR